MFEDNADAYLKRTIMGREVVVAVTGGKLDFGLWEQIFYGEFDIKRRRRVLVKIIGEKKNPGIMTGVFLFRFTQSSNFIMQYVAWTGWN